MSSIPAFSPDRDRAVRWAEFGLIFGCVTLIPFDIPVVHQACLPLAALAVLLFVLRGDARPFLQFLRGQPLIVLLVSLLWVVSLFSIAANFTDIMNNMFQQQTGWMRALSQALLLLVTLIFPIYFAFCLFRRGNWMPLITKAAWWALPIPFLVGWVQIANLLHVPGLSHLPYVGAAYEEGSFWRLTSVARESSWFGSFACVILPFLAMDLKRLTGWKKPAGLAAIANLLFFVVLGTSKSAYAAVALELLAGGLIYVVAFRPWRLLAKTAFGLCLVLVALFATSVLAPKLFAQVISPFAAKATTLYNIFLPLLMGDTRSVSIGTRFGMASAGMAMGEAKPLAGVGLGQFGFHAYNFTPLWGLNGETLTWLSNDNNAWPSTSNLYARLIGEAGPLACALYGALRLALLALVGARLLRRDSATWERDLCVLLGMLALIAFDFHRDSFINLDAWVLLGMAIACCQPERTEELELPAGRPTAAYRRIFFGASAAAFILTLAMVHFTPVTYLASATLAPKDKGITIGPAGGTGGSLLEVEPNLRGKSRFQQFRMYWASTTVAAKMLAEHPRLVQAAMGAGSTDAVRVAAYLEDNVAVLLADEQTTVTLRYRNADPLLAKEFLSTAIEETDRMVAEAARRAGRQADQLQRIAIAAGLDFPARQHVLTQAAAQELQSDFDAAGANASFDYIEHPGILREFQSPQPAIAVLFALGLALLIGASAAVLRLFWAAIPSAARGDLAVQR